MESDVDFIGVNYYIVGIVRRSFNLLKMFFEVKDVEIGERRM